MKISESDGNVFLGYAAETLAKFKVPVSEQRDVVAFVQSLKSDIVEQGSDLPVDFSTSGRTIFAGRINVSSSHFRWEQD